MKPIGSILKNVCPDCGSDMILRKTKKEGRLFYGCVTFPDCRSGHGAHQVGKLQGESLGIPADKETKQWRIKAHDVFDELWKAYGYKRKDAYKLLKNVMGLTRNKAHIGKFNIDQCKQLIEKIKSSPLLE